ncbi:MAG: SAM-dependent methyltransferase [Treponema sp.]|nr:SAM-dependent methyltransferase [Treponema sp.]
MTLSITFSKPAKNVEALLDRPYTKIRIWRKAEAGLAPSSGTAAGYDAEFFTETQSFRRAFTEEELDSFKQEHAGKTFRSVVERTESQEITTLANRHGEVRTFSRPLKNPAPPTFASSADRKKKYILDEHTPVPFLVRLGVMTKEGTVVARKYDKFRQINRFLEYIDDILDELTDRAAGNGGFTPERPLRIVDFGCGKSYLTFAIYHFLTDIRHIATDITGLDLKKDVIADCQKLAEESGYGALHFKLGDIASYSDAHRPDMVVTLHACDRATDYALNWAIRQGAAAILSVPCCQHELNEQLTKAAPLPDSSPFASLTRHGILRERLAALATDAVRAELLEQAGYRVQAMEFIDMSHTPKNILIRAVKKREGDRASADGQKSISRSKERETALLAALGVRQELDGLLRG